MLLRMNAMAAAASLSMLAACASGHQTSQAGSALVPPPLGAAASPDKDCGGTGGVEVLPCPVRLTRHTKPGIVVTVSGPHVVNSYLGQLNGCFNGQNCYNAEREGSSQTQWRITSGRACGGADVEFYGVDRHGAKRGYFFLKVSNHYCP